MLKKYLDFASWLCWPALVGVEEGKDPWQEQSEDFAAGKICRVGWP